MGKTFFSVMQQVQKDINRGVISNDSVTLFNRLKETVETCDFTSSKATKFVCKNWNSSFVCVNNTEYCLRAFHNTIYDWTVRYKRIWRL